MILSFLIFINIIEKVIATEKRLFKMDILYYKKRILTSIFKKSRFRFWGRKMKFKFIPLGDKVNFLAFLTCFWPEIGCFCHFNLFFCEKQVEFNLLF